MARFKLGYWLVAVLCLLTSFVANAGMIIVKYKDVYGDNIAIDRTSVVGSTVWLNSVSDITVAVEAEPGQKVRVRMEQNRQPIIEKTTPVVKQGDSFIYDGEAIGGESVVLPAIYQSNADDGTALAHRLYIDILSQSGEVIKSKSFDIRNDLVPIEMQYPSGHAQYIQKDMYSHDIYDPRRDVFLNTWPLEVKYHIRTTGARLARVATKMHSLKTGKIVDLGSFKVESYYDPPYFDAGKSTFPDGTGEYELIATLYDQAGNKTIFEDRIEYDAEAPEFEIIGVRSADTAASKPWSHIQGLESYVKYTPGMVVKDSNPSFLVRTRHQQHSAYSQYGLKIPTQSDYEFGGCYSETRFDLCVTKDVEDDGTYVYSTTGPASGYSQHSLSNYTIFARDIAGNWGSQSAKVRVDPNYSVAAFVVAATLNFKNGKKIEMYGTPGGKEWNALVPKMPGYYDTPDYFDGIENVTATLVEPAGNSYVVRRDIGGLYNTNYVTFDTIMPGEIEATVPLDRDTREYEFCGPFNSFCTEYLFSLTTEPQELFELGTWLFGQQYANAYTNNFYIEGYSVEILHQQTTRVNGTLIATESRTGLTHEIAQSYSKRGESSNGSVLVFRTDDLPLTAYDFSVRVEGEDGNTDLFQLESRDFTPADAIDPEVTLNANGVQLKHAVIDDSSDIVVTVTDNLAGSSIESAKIIGGPSGNTVSATWSKISDTSYRITGPSLAASAAANDYAITIVGIDAVGNTAVETVAFTVDGVKPSVSLRYASDVLSGASIDDVADIRIRVTDNLSGADIQSAKIKKPDGSTVNAHLSRLDSKNFSVTGPGLSDSQSANDYTLTVVGVDAGGKTTAASASFTVDAANPDVALLVGSTSLDGSILTAGDQITIRVTDNLVGAQIKSAVFNGGADGKTANADLTRINGTTFRAPAPVSSGSSSYTLKVVAQDTAGNTGSASAAFVMDPVAPELSLHANGNALSGAAISPADSIEIRITDDRPGADITSVKLKAPNGRTSNVPWQRVATGKYRVKAPSSGASGSYTITVAGADAAGNSDQVSASFTFDASSPELTLSANNKALSGAVIAPGSAIRINVTDNRAGVDLESVKLTAPNGHTSDAIWTRVKAGVFEVSAPASGGDNKYTLKAIAIDVAGNTAQASASFTVDSIDPTITLTARGRNLSGSVLTPKEKISIEISDNRVGAQLESVSVTGPDRRKTDVSWSQINATTFQVNAPATSADDNYTIQAVVADSVGNSAQISATFDVDGIKPTVAMSVAGKPLDGALLQPSSEILVRVTDNRAGTQIDALVLKDSKGKAVAVDWSRINGTTFRVSTPQKTGDNSYTFTVTGADGAGNISQESATFSVDSIAPQLLLQANGKALNGAVIARSGNIQIRLTDNRAGADLQSVKLTSPGGKKTNAGWSRIDSTTYRVDTPTANGDNDYTLEVIGVDGAGNTVRSTASFTVDSIKPGVSLLGKGKPLDGSLLMASDEIRIVVSDNRSGSTIQSLTLKGADGKAVAANWTRLNATTFRLDTLKGDDYTISVTGADAVGNTTQASASFSVDDAQPSLSLTVDGKALNGAVFSPEGQIRIHLSDNRANAQLQSVKLIGPKGKAVSANWNRLNSTTFSLETPDDGNSSDYTLTVVGVDAAGNTDQAAASFTVDAIDPTTTLRADGKPLNGSLLKPSSDIRITVDDNRSGTTIQSLTLKGSNGKAVAANWSRINATTFRLDTPKGDDYTISVTGADAVGNKSQASAAFSVDDDAPSVSFTVDGKALNGAVFSPEGKIRIHLSDNRANAQLQSVKLIGPKGKAVSANWNRLDSTTFSLETPDDGKSSDYTLTVVGVDAAGNTDQATASFTVDAIDPTLTLLADGKPLNGTLLTPSSAIRIIVDDNRSGTTIQSLTLNSADGKAVAANWTRLNATTFRLDTPKGDDYTISVTGADAVGNTTHATAAFSVDDILPDVSMTVDGQALNGTLFSPAGQIRIHLADNRPGVKIDSVTLTGPNGKPADTSWTRINASTYGVATPASSDHKYTYTTVVIDAAGNKAQLVASFTVDAIVPDVALLTNGKPLEGAHIKAGTDLRIKVTDNRSGTSVKSASFTGSDGKTVSASLKRLNSTTFHVQTPAAGNDDYTLNVVGMDGVGNTTPASAAFVLDTINPEIVLRANGEQLDGMTLTKTNDIQITVTDNHIKATVQSAIITGGPKGQTLEATWSATNDVQFRVTGPYLYASESENDYTITVVGVDAVGNTSQASASFTYQPPVGEVVAGANNGVAIIPAAEHAFTSVESQPFIRMDRTPLDGQHAVYATLRSGSDVGLVVNGVSLTPGQTKRVAKTFDFSGTGGRLRLPVAAQSVGDKGSAHLEFKIDAPGVGKLSAPVEVWRANVDLTSESWKVKQGFEAIEINAAADEPTRCELTRDVEQARAHDALSDPVCYIEWDMLPPGLIPARTAAPRTESIGLRGYAETTGEQDIEFSVWIYDEAHEPYLMQQRRFKLEVIPPYLMGDFVLAPREEISEAYREVQTVNITLKQSEGDECELTLSEDDAIRLNARGRLACFVEWTNLPEGLAQVEWFNTPNLTGILETSGKNLVSWDTYIFTPQGAKIKVNSQTLPIEVSDPPLPVLSMDDKHLVTEGLYAAPMEGGYLGDIKAISYSADLRLTLSRDGEQYESVVAPGGWGDQNIAQRRVNSEPRDLWTQTPYNAKAQYTQLPMNKAEMSFKVLAVPAQSISPEIEVAHEEVLNTEPLAVTVRMNDPFQPDGYDPAQMGHWKVRLVRMKGLDSEPLTEYMPVEDSGKTTFNLNLEDVESPRLRLSAEAELVSPVADYKRVVLSPRPIYLTVLRGKPIEAAVEGRRLSGLAPLTAVMTLDVANRLDNAALGDVTWEMSADNKNWEALESDRLYETRMTHIFERGVYWVRANVTNANSGAKLRTPTVRINSYIVPKVEIEGPENAFIGSTGHYKAIVKKAQDEVVYEWSVDGGQNWQPGDETLSVARDEQTRVAIAVRGRYETAPADDSQAWDKARTRLSFREPIGPRVRITGRSLIETGKPSGYRAIVLAPYRNMDIKIHGKWLLPDASEVEGLEASYTATHEDLLNKRVKLSYHAWVEGYEAQGAVADADKTLRIWQYRWPEFRIHSRTTADYVPAEIVARLRSMTSTRISELEEPVIDWEIPDGLTVTEEGIEALRVMTVEKPGAYTLRAHIKDARGNSATAEQTLVFETPPPYTFDISYSASNRYNRAPMEVRVRPNVRGGHPRDRIEQYIYKLDNEPVETSGRYGAMTINESGKHTINVSIETKMGKVAVGELTIEANENVEPTCKIKSSNGSSYWLLSANCEDPDGRMTGYEWYVNGERVGLSGARITVRDEGGVPPQVRLIGIDNGGARSHEVMWTGG